MAVPLAIFLIVLICLAAWLCISIRLRPVDKIEVEGDALMVGTQNQLLAADDNHPIPTKREKRRAPTPPD
jgi:hypothetical protein